MIIYKFKCKKCGKETKMMLARITRNHGVKLACLDCNTETDYMNIEKLIPIELQGGIKE